MASIVVLSYVGIGFVVAAAQAFLSVELKFPPDWSSAMLSIASAALGFILGRDKGPQTPSPTIGASVLSAATSAVESAAVGALSDVIQTAPVATPPKVKQ